MHDPRQRAVRGRGADHDLDRATAVDRPGVEVVTRSRLDRDRLTGDRGGVQAGPPGPDGAVGRGPLAGAHDQDVADDEVVRGDGDLVAVTQHRGGRGDQPEQGTQAAAGPGHSMVLEPFGDGEQDPEQGGLGDLSECDGADHGDRHQGADTDPAVAQIA